MRRLIVLFVVAVFVFLNQSTAQNPKISAQDKEYFIESFSMIAVAEMNAHQIPASIKLAQAILESNWGTSELATKGNNFYGIKCKASWTGERIYREDDDYDASGKLIASCFRKYSDPSESFEAHSLFLKKNKRYAFLFDLGNDYSKWAYGLKDAGYATNPKYPIILIDIIETYHLDQYDKQNAVAQYHLTPKFDKAPAKPQVVSQGRVSPSSNASPARIATDAVVESDVKEENYNNLPESTEASAPPSAYRLPDNYRPRTQNIGNEKGGKSRLVASLKRNVVERSYKKGSVQLHNKLSSKYSMFRTGR